MRIFLAWLFCLFASPALAAVTVEKPWAPPSLAGSTTGIAYLTLRSDSDDALVGVSSPLVTSIEMHTHLMDGEVMRMRQLASVPLARGETVVFKPRGLHLMLFGLKQPLTEGMALPLTLRFAHAKPVSIRATVSQQMLLDSLR